MLGGEYTLDYYDIVQFLTCFIILDSIFTRIGEFCVLESLKIYQKLSERDSKVGMVLSKRGSLPYNMGVSTPPKNGV